MEGILILAAKALLVVAVFTVAAMVGFVLMGHLMGHMVQRQRDRFAAEMQEETDRAIRAGLAAIDETERRYWLNPARPVRPDARWHVPGENEGEAAERLLDSLSRNPGQGCEP